ncbi:ABC transporter permease [Pseudorhodoferax sp. Leaf265]|uniref:ABC transporter permease n=1 Tax=Pseudorhodoferax sp. Leaf265 TaxID=1736315 RepID=UPI0006F90574|nr:ABC transporter permease [Pseudorhodoferax sp. Leaf265]KQP09070.1 ABC transporter permease [Pseudorhodoferax sp. Leaf265]
MRGPPIETWLPPAGAVVLLLLWEGSVRAFGISAFVLPPPTAVARSLWTGLSNGVYLQHALLTATEALGGFVLALAAGVVLGALIAEVRWLEKALYPLLVALQAMPKVALAPLVIIWLGYGINSKIVLAGLLGFFPILINTIAGLKSCDAGKVDVMRALGAGRWQTFRWVKLPNALPFVFAGINVAASFVVLGAVTGEFLGAKEGLGTLILLANNELDTAQIFSILLMLGLLGFVLYSAVRFAQRRLLAWAPAENLPST